MIVAAGIPTLTIPLMPPIPQRPAKVKSRERLTKHNSSRYVLPMICRNDR
jgi:hypothetical protein